jgi:hypothetical protein
MGWKLSTSWPAAIASLVIGASACGGIDRDSVVVRVGHSSITKATVDHWQNVIRRGGAFTGFRGQTRGARARDRALALLISSDWLIGEAARQGMPVHEAAVENSLAERMKAGGGSEFREMLGRTGQTLEGVKLELSAEIALEAIRRELARRAAEITPPEVAEFYRKHQALLGGTEARVIDIIENIPSASAATALVRRVGTGKRFAKLALHKRIQHSTGVLMGPASKKQVDHAIFTAEPGVVSRPMRFLEGWTVFVVRKVIPPRAQPLAKIRTAVVAKLVEQRKRAIAHDFDAEYRNRWVRRTSCLHGYIAAGCPQYSGPLGAYEDPFSGD